MRYMVTWWQAAEDELLRIWLDAADRGLITVATRDIDRLLGNQPSTVGEVDHEGLRRLTIAPLCILYSVDDDDRTVRVWTVRLIHR